ncbi:hypothetical protein HAX54_038035 [Datura stramonium]|uniref:Tetratricopeptide repeat protein n=1 Tax=Datura stramonium TaxID=4076 RepID=A0ABS8SHL1_DATST|nr:hypothetical protein [Datura stramonium]
MNALRLEPANHEAWFNLGKIAKMEGSLQQAADFFQAAHELKLSAPVQKDLEIRRFKDLNKRKREEPVARGRLFVHDLGFLSKVPGSDDFEGTKKEWEEIIAFGARGYQRSGKMQPDTIVLKGMPSRWFAETRVSSKPSMLVTHTIVSALGKIRNLHVAEDNGIGEDADEGDIVSGLHCKIVVRFEKHKDFFDALKVLCGRSMQKQGSPPELIMTHHHEVSPALKKDGEREIQGIRGRSVMFITLENSLVKAET